MKKEIQSAIESIETRINALEVKKSKMDSYFELYEIKAINYTIKELKTDIRLLKEAM